MRKYESVYIVRPDLDEETTKSVVEKFSNFITEKGGQLEKVDKWGKRRLAYPINDFHEGYYVLMYFNAEAGLPEELEHVYKISDNIIRYLIIRDEE